MIRHQTSKSGHLCCNTESLPHHPRVQSQNCTKIRSSDREQSQCEYKTTPVGLYEHFFSFVLLQSLYFCHSTSFTDLGTACQLYSCHSPNRGCCMSEFRIKHAECREQSQYLLYDANENINKEIKKPLSKAKIAVTAIETVWGKMRTTFQQNCTQSHSPTRKTFSFAQRVIKLSSCTSYF